MTEALAGPYCAMLLGDLGADVVKVERPVDGDQARGWGPPFLEGESAYFLGVNRNKRSVELDIKRQTDLGLLRTLIGRADVFLTNNPRLESLARAGLDPDTLRGRHPRLVYGAISGYGHTGPKANRSGYDIIAQGEAGLMALTGPQDGGPSRFPSPMADISGGIYTCLGVLAALYARDNRATGTDRGELIDVALVDAQLSWLANIGASYFATGQAPPTPRECPSDRDAVSARASPRQDDDHRRGQRAAMGEVLQDPRGRADVDGRRALRHECAAQRAPQGAGRRRGGDPAADGRLPSGSRSSWRPAFRPVQSTFPTRR